MLKIRLAKCGKHKSPFFRIVLTEHTKPVKSGYQSVLGWYNPINHQIEAKIDQIKTYINQGAQPTERIAKLLFNLSQDDFFKKYYSLHTNKRETKKKKE